MTENKTRARLRITGRVQGVFFRASATEIAKKLQLTGWVKNLSDGSVESVVEGDKEKIDQYIEWCHEGSSAANVENVDVTWSEYKNEFNTFKVEYI